jgi:aldehyde:ferredoxin oxidoreductase
MAYDSYKVDFGLVPYGIPVPNEVDRFDEEGKGKIAKVIQDFGVVPDILGICKFYVYVGLGPSQLAKMVSSLTGWDIDGKELLKIGERCFNLLRMFNIREGISKRDDFLPERMLKLPEFGKYSSVENCEIKNYNKMLEECYEARGWNKETGIPYDDKLREVGLKG